MTISEAFGKTQSARTCPDISKSVVFRVSAPAAPPRPRTQLASLGLAQSPGGRETSTDTTGTQTTAGAQTTTTKVTTTPAATSPIDPGTVRVVPDIQTVQAPNGEKVIDKIDPKIRPTASDGAQAKQLRKYALPLSVAPEGVSQGERRAVTQEAVLRRPTRSAAQPLGRLIDLTVVLTGLKLRCVQLRWSLYDAKGGVRVKESWLRDRQGLSFVAQSNTSVSSSPAFWVPLPRRGGTFFVRMGIFQDDGTRLTFARSPTFSQEPVEAGGA